MLDEMQDWFAIWTPKENESTIEKSARYKKMAGGLKVAQSALTMVEGLSGLGNNSVAKKERENEYQAIENQVLAAQDQIIESLNYNTDQAITYAARGNVAISSPVLRERFKKGAAEAGRDFAMLEANANVQRVRSDISYARKRRENTERAIKGVNQFLFSMGMYGMGGFGGGDQAIDPMQQASASNTINYK